MNKGGIVSVITPVERLSIWCLVFFVWCCNRNRHRTRCFEDLRGGDPGGEIYAASPALADVGKTCWSRTKRMNKSASGAGRDSHAHMSRRWCAEDERSSPKRQRFVIDSPCHGGILILDKPRSFKASICDLNS